MTLDGGHYAIGLRDGGTEWHVGTSLHRECRRCHHLAPRWVPSKQERSRALADVMHQFRIEADGLVCHHPADDIADCENDADWLMQHGRDILATAPGIAQLQATATDVTAEPASYTDGRTRVDAKARLALLDTLNGEWRR